MNERTNEPRAYSLRKCYWKLVQEPLRSEFFKVTYVKCRFLSGSLVGKERKSISLVSSFEASRRTVPGGTEGRTTWPPREGGHLTPGSQPSILPPRVSEPKPSQEALELSDPSDTTPVRFQEIFKDTLRKFSKAQGAQLGAL